MLLVFIVGIVRLVASALLVALFPVAMLSAAIPNVDMTPLAGYIRAIVDIFVWLFGREAYGFFVITVIITTFFIPAAKLMTFIGHVFLKVRSFFSL